MTHAVRRILAAGGVSHVVVVTPATHESDFDEALAEFDRTALSGEVTLGAPDDYASTFLPRILARFAESHARVHVELVGAGGGDELAELFDATRLDRLGAALQRLQLRVIVTHLTHGALSFRVRFTAA